MQAAEFDEDEKDDADGRRPRFGGGMLSDALSGTITAQKKKNTTVTSALQSHISHLKSRLSPAIDALCAPLTTFLDNNRDHPSTASCLALAYLSLLLVPSLPVSWMQQSIRERYPTLASFVERGVSDIYGGETDVQEALEGRMRRDGKGLPWRKPGVVGAKMAERMIWGSVLDQLPGVLRGNILQEPEKDSQPKEGLSRTPPPFIPSAIVVTTTLAAALAGYLTYTSYYTTKNLKTGKRKLSDMGEAGALFSALEFRGGGAMMEEGEGEARARKVPPVAGVEVGVGVGGSGEGGV